MKKIGCSVLYAFGALFFIYGLIIAISNGILAGIVPKISVIWLVVLCEKNLREKLMKRKKVAMIISGAMIILLLINSIAELSSLRSIPTDLRYIIWPGLRIVLFQCPNVFVLMGLILILSATCIMKRKMEDIGKEER